MEEHLCNGCSWESHTSPAILTSLIQFFNALFYKLIKNQEIDFFSSVDTFHSIWIGNVYQMLPGLEGFSYGERLDRFGLFSLELQKLRGGLIEVRAIMRGMERVDC